MTAAIRSDGDLDDYLVAHSGGPVPFDALDARWRRVLIDSLEFGPQGLVGLRFDVLEDQLTRAEARGILALFGLAHLADSLTFEGSAHVRAPTEARAVENPELEQAIDRLADASYRNAPDTVVAQRYMAEQEIVDRIGLDALGDADLRDHYRNTSGLAAAVHSAEYARGARRAFDELHQRGIDRPRDRDRMLGLLIAQRQLDAATRLAEDSPPSRGLRLPKFVDASSANAEGTLWYVSGDGSALIRRDASIANRSLLVVVASPWCEFAGAAGKDVFADPDLAEKMADASLWIMPDGYGLDVLRIDDVVAWNHAHPNVPMHYAHRQADWPMIASWATPTFYFFRNGKLIDSFSGWMPGEDNIGRLRRGFHEIGFDR